MIIHTNIVKEQTPKGKRSVRNNVWGNANAYVAGRFWKTIGPTHAVGTDEKIQEFLNGAD